MNLTQKEKIHTKAVKVVYGGLLIAIGIVLPQAFHMFGQNAGMAFLPIHIPVLMAGLLLGPYYGGVVGLLVPVLSSVLTGMPPAPKLYFMLFELVTYGIVTGIMIRKHNVYVSMLTAMLAGRICYGVSLVAGMHLLQMNTPFMNQAAFVGGLLSGVPGMILQLVLIPILYLALKKGGFTFER